MPPSASPFVRSTADWSLGHAADPAAEALFDEGHALFEKGDFAAGSAA